MACGVLYIIGKLLERKCLKWARIAHLDIRNTSYGQKKGKESNCQFDSRLEKVRNRPNLLIFRWCATYRWKVLNKGYNFASDHISIWGRFAKLWGSKVVGVPTWAILGLPLGSPRTKNHLDVGPVERCKVYDKGEGGGFPQVQVVVSLVCPCCLWLVLAPKVLQLRTNHLMWVLCRPVWMSEACQFFLVPSRSSSTPLYPSKCYELRSVPRLLFLLLFFTWTHNWVFQGVGNVSASLEANCITFYSVMNVLCLFKNISSPLGSPFNAINYILVFFSTNKRRNHIMSVEVGNRNSN